MIKKLYLPLVALLVLALSSCGKYTNHVRRHTHATFSVRLQRILQVFSNLDICFRGWFRWLA